MAALPRRGKNTIARTAWLALSLLLLLLLATPAHSRQHQGLTSTTSAQEGIELFLIDLSPEEDARIRPDRTTHLAPPAPKPNSNVPGGPLG
ncbi:hypothetical protein PVAP13_2NG284200 [Panicum virgatum]|uniref:Uncharacterized protein n=1 Tax=Panicum virgatum TaxID=38727 RepID=A0A8T0VMU6_PANVG|nr:hypothetical protein PVAP13_2NG284200 [Panicum virgatum]